MSEVLMLSLLVLRTPCEPGQAICAVLALKPCCNASTVVLHFLLSRRHDHVITGYNWTKDGARQY